MGTDKLVELMRLPLKEYLSQRAKIQEKELTLLHVQGDPTAETLIRSIWTNHWMEYRMELLSHMADAIQAVVDTSDAYNDTGDPNVLLAHNGGYMRRFRELLDLYKKGLE